MGARYERLMNVNFPQWYFLFKQVLTQDRRVIENRTGNISCGDLSPEQFILERVSAVLFFAYFLHRLP